jgi:cardiolipin synthase
MSTWFIIFNLCHLVVVIVACSHLLLQDKSPTTQIAWVLGIMLIPVFGVATYLIIGTDRLRLGRERRRLAFVPLDQPEFAPVATADPETFGAGSDPGTISWLTALSRINGCHATPGNQIQPMLTGSELYEHLEASIRASQTRIWICFYVWRGDELGKHFVALLAEAARRGV